MRLTQHYERGTRLLPRNANDVDVIMISIAGIAAAVAGQVVESRARSAGMSDTEARRRAASSMRAVGGTLAWDPFEMAAVERQASIKEIDDHELRLKATLVNGAISGISGIGAHAVVHIMDALG
jgi:hypothetical protein